MFGGNKLSPRGEKKTTKKKKKTKIKLLYFEVF